MRDSSRGAPNGLAPQDDEKYNSHQNIDDSERHALSDLKNVADRADQREQERHDHDPARGGAGEPRHQEADEAVAWRQFRYQTALNGCDFRHAGKSGNAAGNEHHDQDEAKYRNAETPRRFRVAADRAHVETEAGPRHGEPIEDQRGQGVDEAEMHSRMKESRQPRGFDKGRRFRIRRALRAAPGPEDEIAHDQRCDIVEQQRRDGLVDEPQGPNRPGMSAHKPPPTKPQTVSIGKRMKAG